MQEGELKVLLSQAADMVSVLMLFKLWFCSLHYKGKFFLPTCAGGMLGSSAIIGFMGSTGQMNVSQVRPCQPWQCQRWLSNAGERHPSLLQWGNLKTVRSGLSSTWMSFEDDYLLTTP